MFGLVSRRRRRLYYYCVGIAVFIFFLLAHYSPLPSLGDSSCANAESQKTLKKLCDRYHNDKVAGSMCSDLCDRKTLVFSSCLNYRNGKQVYLMEWSNIRVIFKSRWAHIDGGEVLQTTLTEEGDPDIAEFTRLVEATVRLNLPQDEASETGLELVSKMWSLDFAQLVAEWKRQDGHGRASTILSAMHSIWTLMLQDEYRLLKLHGGDKPLPRILGTCGHFYAVEYLPPGRSLAPGLLEVTSMRRAPWRRRAFMAVALLDAVAALDTRFPETLHMCDMKGDNFGISPDGSIKTIDVDTTIFDTRLRSDLSYPNCSTNEPCDFFDCHGWCDVTGGRCTDIRLNNNLQALCYKVFSAHSGNGFVGLLDNPPEKYKAEVRAALTDCARPARPSRLHLPGCLLNGATFQCPPSQSQLETFKFRADADTYDRLLELLIVSVRDEDLDPST